MTVTEPVMPHLKDTNSMNAYGTSLWDSLTEKKRLKNFFVVLKRDNVEYGFLCKKHDTM